MYNAVSIFTLILISFQRVVSSQMQVHTCCEELFSAFSTPKDCLNISCNSTSESTTIKTLESTLFNGDESLYTTSDLFSTDHPLENEDTNVTIVPEGTITFLPESTIDISDSDYYQLPNGSIMFDSYSGRNISFSPLFRCKKSKSAETRGDLYIKCLCRNVTYFHHCCPPGHLLFNKLEVIVRHWECDEETEKEGFKEYLNLLVEDQEPYILIYNNIGQSNESASSKTYNESYIVIKGREPYSDSSNGNLERENIEFDIKFTCEIQYASDNITGYYQELICMKDAYPVEFQKAYEVMKYLAIFLYSATLLVFTLLPKLRTMKSNIIICQAVAYLVLNLSDIPYSLGNWKPEFAECIITGYMLHFWNLAGSFWINVMCIDLALTFGSRTFLRTRDRKKFFYYSIYGWGSPILILLVTALFGLVIELPEGYVSPDIHVEHCWFATYSGMWAYHYGIILALTIINGPFLCFAIYHISRDICNAKILHKTGSGLHIGKKAKKASRTRMIIYFNLALLVGCPRIFYFIKLLYNNETLSLVLNFTTLIRAVFIFAFVCCKPKVFALIRQQYCGGKFSISTFFAAASSTRSENESSTKTNESVVSESLSTAL